MDGKTRTLAFQVSEELFGKIKEHLKKTGLSQKDFVIGLIEQALTEAEAADTTKESESNKQQPLNCRSPGASAVFTWR